MRARPARSTLETFRFDDNHCLDYDYDFWYDQILDRVLIIVCGSNLVAVLLVTTGIAEDLVVNITSSKLRSRTHSEI